MKRTCGAGRPAAARAGTWDAPAWEALVDHHLLGVGAQPSLLELPRIDLTIRLETRRVQKIK